MILIMFRENSWFSTDKVFWVLFRFWTSKNDEANTFFLQLKISEGVSDIGSVLNLISSKSINKCNKDYKNWNCK